MTEYKKPNIKSFKLDNFEEGKFFISDAWRFSANSPWALKWNNNGTKWALSG